jgi:hypothetical protein
MRSIWWWRSKRGLRRDESVDKWAEEGQRQRGEERGTALEV